MKRLFPLVLLFSVAACGQRDSDPGPGGVSIGEARALDDAAAMLERRRLPAAALTGEARAPRATPTPAPAASPAN